MSVIQASNISISFADRRVLDSVSCSIDEKARIALTGDNGSGKTTFLKILAGVMQPDSGVVTRSKNIRISYLPQSGAVLTGKTLLEEIEKAYDWIRPLEREKEEIEHRLGESDVREAEATRLVERRAELEEALLEGGYYYRQGNIEKVLTGLGFRRESFTASPATLSGGWRMRVSLARVLLERPDLLLLDEPTNYLDIEAREWLEVFLSSYPGGVILVSHDRYFLDVTVNRIAELFLGSLSVYHGNYSAYEKQRSAELMELTGAYNRQVKEIQKIEDFIERFRYNASKASLVQSRIRYLEKLQRLEIPESLKKIHVTFPKAPPSGERVLTLNSVCKSYSGQGVFRNLSLDLVRGDRLALTGVNGAGKSTLMRIIAGIDTCYEGRVEYGTGIRTGYFSQDSADTLTGTSTVLAETEKISTRLTDQELRNLLGAFLFRGDDIYKILDVLSGGEKSRLALMKLLLSPVNLLLLDEPTSHLDMRSKEVLLSALLDFKGTLVFVAHDRSFVEQLATRVLDLGGNEPVYYYGGYDYYLYKKQGQDSPVKGAGVPESRAVPEGKKDRLKEKDYKRTLRKLRNREEEIMETLATLEGDYTSLEGDLALPENYTDGDKVKKIKRAMEINTRQQEFLHREWETVDAELAALEEPETL